jgi:hypothetical protein
MGNEIALGLVCVILIGAAIAVVGQAISFIFDVPKQLKRIADALERKKEDGK